MWLTAFVVKSFAQAKPYIFIDEEDLQKSIDWFESKQLENGCFPQVRMKQAWRSLLVYFTGGLSFTLRERESDITFRWLV